MRINVKLFIEKHVPALCALEENNKLLLQLLEDQTKIQHITSITDYTYIYWFHQFLNE